MAAGTRRMHAGRLSQERFVVFLGLSLSRTQDDKGRIRWSFFGSSEQGPEKAFWKSFYDLHGKSASGSRSIFFWKGFFAQVYGEKVDSLSDLNQLGFRDSSFGRHLRNFLTGRKNTLLPWADRFLWNPECDARYLLTFQPLCAAGRSRYVKVTWQVSLTCFRSREAWLFWGMPSVYQASARAVHGDAVASC